MRTLTSLFSILALTCAIGCSGGDNDDDGGDTADASVGAADAAGGGGADAMPAGGSNLGAICNQGMPCQGTADACFGAEGAPAGFCSLLCGSGVEITTDENGAVPVPQDPSFHATCMADYNGVGTPGCVLIVGGLPTPPQQPEPNTQYSVDLACGIQCEQGTNACPSGLSCQQGYCFP